jgi:glutamine amidotransferase
MRGRIKAHNGGFGELPRLDEQLGDYASLVQGDTDSERYFALITQQIDAHGGDVAAGIAAAAGWIATHLPVVALNTIVAAPGRLWALRYPDQHALHILERPADAAVERPADAAVERPADAAVERPADANSERAADAGLHVRSATSSMHVPELADAPSVIIASEELDGEGGWRMLVPGELIHVGPDLTVHSQTVLPDPPARLIPLPAGNPNIDT